jgi:hypothetical protein
MDDGFRTLEQSRHGHGGEPRNREGITEGFAQEGARLSICGRNVQTLEVAAQSLSTFGVVRFAKPTDVTQGPEAEAFAEETLKHYGQIRLKQYIHVIVQPSPSLYVIRCVLCYHSGCLRPTLRVTGAVCPRTLNPFVYSGHVRALMG